MGLLNDASTLIAVRMFRWQFAFVSQVARFTRGFILVLLFIKDQKTAKRLSE